MFTKEQAIALLTEKKAERGRLPLKEDFDAITVSRIKSKLGPWPRALEAAGLKEVPNQNRQLHSHIAQKKAKAKALHSKTMEEENKQ